MTEPRVSADWEPKWEKHLEFPETVVAMQKVLYRPHWWSCRKEKLIVMTAKAMYEVKL